jgi:hypothetical protein
MQTAVFCIVAVTLLLDGATGVIGALSMQISFQLVNYDLL